MTIYILCASLGLLLHWLLKIQYAVNTCKKWNKPFSLPYFFVDNMTEMIISVVSLVTLFLLIDRTQTGTLIFNSLPVIFKTDRIVFFIAGYTNSSWVFSIVRMVKGVLKVE